MGLFRRKEPRTLEQLEQVLPNAAIEIVGEREEVVIHTGWTMTPSGRLVPMDEFLD